MKFYAITDIGRKRELNEDYIYTSGQPIGALPNLFIVADGMGGHKAGDYASMHTVDRFVEVIRELGEEHGVQDAINEAVTAANAYIYQRSRENSNLSGMGTTLVLASCIGNEAIVANIGDSRLYLVNDAMTQITRDHSLVEEMVTLGGIDREMARNHPDKNIITMLLIFLTAGAFVGVVGRSSAESVAYFMLSLIPARFSVAVLFVVACFVSVAMGTSVGTITLITPIAVSVSKASGFDMALCIGSVMGGSMFGDNLSFISDTTIAACNGQGCQMKDKFRENFGIALPAAIATLVLILVLSFQTDIAGRVSKSYNLVQIIPYVLVLIGGIIGINVFVVLLIGIVSGSIIMRSHCGDRSACQYGFRSFRDVRDEYGGNPGSSDVCTDP